MTSAPFDTEMQRHLEELAKLGPPWSRDWPLPQPTPDRLQRLR